MRYACLFLLAAGCATTTKAPPEPQDVAFAQLYLAERVDAEPAAAAPVREPVAFEIAPRTRADEITGLLLVPEGLDAVAQDDDKLAGMLAKPIRRSELEALAYLRSPAVRAARERYEAARTGYRQATDLADLVSIYRSFLRETTTRVGPEKSRRATAMIAPYPNVDALSAEVVRRSVAIAFEHLRAVVRDTVASAQKAHADAARLTAARRVLAADVKLHDSLVRVLRARYESGKASQAGLLTFESRLEALRTELAIMDREQVAVRARWNRLLHRLADAPVFLDLAPASMQAAPEQAPDVTKNQELRVATLAAERAAVGVRLAETMTLPRLDLGTSRFERERSKDRFPEPGRMVMPRPDFGVREAQVSEMRAKQRALQEAQAATLDRIRTAVQQVLFRLDAAEKRWRIQEREIVPRARKSYDSSLAAYEGNQTGYLELLDAARMLLKARLARIDARRDHAHAHADLLVAVGARLQEGTK